VAGGGSRTLVAPFAGSDAVVYLEGRGLADSETADLSVTQSDGPDPVAAGATTTYTVRVSNAGPGGATAVVLTDTLPEGATYVSATASQGSCSQAAGVVTCNLGSLAASASATVSVLARTSAANVPSMTNTAAVDGAEQDGTSSNDRSSETTTVQATADLSVGVSESPDPVEPGADLTYTIVARNAGPSPASSVRIRHELPEGSTYRSAAGTGWACAHAAGVVTCDRSSLAPASNAPAIAVQVTAPATAGTVGSRASVSATTSDPDPADDAQTVTTKVERVLRADLGVTLRDSADPIVATLPTTYTARVTNAGPDPANSVVLRHAVAAGTTVSSVSPSQGTCAVASGTVTCQLGALGSGGAATVKIAVRSGGSNVPSMSQTVTVDAAEADPVAANDSATEATAVQPAADLTLTNSATPASAAPGTEIAFALTVRNRGPHAATTARVAGAVPEGTMFRSASGSGWTCAHESGTVTCTRTSSLAPGTTAPAIVVRVLAPLVAAQIVGRASVSAEPSDPVLGDNAASATVTVGDVARCETVDDLERAILAAGLDPGQEQRLLARAVVAEKALVADNHRRAFHEVRRVASAVERLGPGFGLAETEAEMLVGCAQRVLATIAGGDGEPRETAVTDAPRLRRESTRAR